ncbi:MAG: hypothetical protein ABIP54_02935 [Candidatus Andersenbacteria bacterium]
MTFQSASDLFEVRPREITDPDIQHYLEKLFRDMLNTDAVYCAVSGGGKSVRIRVHDPAHVQRILLSEPDVRKLVMQDMDCEIGGIRVMLE